MYIVQHLTFYFGLRHHGPSHSKRKIHYHWGFMLFWARVLRLVYSSAFTCRLALVPETEKYTLRTQARNIETRHTWRAVAELRVMPESMINGKRGGGEDD